MRAAVAWRAIGINGDVSQLARHSAASVYQLAAHDQATADSGAERQQYDVATAARGTAPEFAERPGVGVVIKDDLAAD